MKTINEKSVFRLVWEIFLISIAMVSIIKIPYDLAFNNTNYLTLLPLIVVIDIFFIIDIYLNFYCSYRKGGIEVLNSKIISKQYIRKHFTIDIIANFPFDIIALIIFKNYLVWGIPFVLLIRLLRVLRISRMFRIFRRWKSQSWSNAGYIQIASYLLIISLIIHWISSIWFFSAYISGFPVDSWAVKAGIQFLSPMEQYIRSLYWSITTMTTIGFGDITPGKSVEYLITIPVMLLGASMYAFGIGGIASILSNLNLTKAKYWNRVEATKQYLHSKKIPHDLSKKVSQYYEYVWDRHQGLEIENLFNDLPKPLRLEILYKLTEDIIEKVPLFKYSSPFLRKILLNELKMQTFTPGDMIVNEGEPGEEIFLISKGKVEIISAELNKNYGTFEDGDYFGDLSLILGEHRTASVKAISYCELFLLSLDRFNYIKNNYPEFSKVLKKVSAKKSDKITKLVMEGIVL